MSYAGISNQIVRRSFGRLKDIMPVPNLIEVQSKSFNDFVQLDYLPNERREIGLEKVLKSIFPIEYEGKMSLEYIGYELGEWACTCGKLTGIVNRYTWSCPQTKKTGCSRIESDPSIPLTARYKACPICCSRVTIQMPMSVNECRFGGQTFSMPLRIKVQLILWDELEDGQRNVREIKEQEIFFADIPVMADIFEEGNRIKVGDQGIFLINGVDRVIVSQMHRSPGVIFTKSKKVKDAHGKAYFIARIIPARGSWMDFEFDLNDLLYVRIDKKKKLLVTTLLQAIGINRSEIIPLFYNFDKILVRDELFVRSLDSSLIGTRITKEMLPEGLLQNFIGRRINQEILDRLSKDKILFLEIGRAQLLNRIIAKDVIDQKTGEIIAEQGSTIDEEKFNQLSKLDGLSFEVIASTGLTLRPAIAVTLTHDHCHSQDEALQEVHVKLWPGDSSSISDIKTRLENIFFSRRLYDLTDVGRIRMNKKLGLNISKEETALTREDIVATLRYLTNLREKGEGELDDIDHLGNRRVRLVGELLANQVYLGFARIERIVKERFRLQDSQAVIMPQDLLNVKPLTAVLREFFGTGQLSQFMDQANPLSEIAHKRRLSALGPGGVLKDRATNEVRDVHNSHYGRICPVETPEGQTIGLISSLATYALVNDLGFIETAYRPVIDGKIKDEVIFLDAFEEASKFIAQTDAIVDINNLKDGDVLSRYQSNFIFVDSKKIDYVDLSPKQIVSVASALIPFLEHDDPTRALMGANMQRQAVPLVRCQSPLVGTGMEKEVCKASGAVIYAKRAGTVEYVFADKIVIRTEEHEFSSSEDWLYRGVDVYNLKKFQRSSYDTWLHQTPIVSRGQKIVKGQILTNGTSCQGGELALGSNLLVAFMPWHGYNFEDAIVVSDRLVTDDALTSIQIDEYIVDSRDTKLGPEEITADIPNVSEQALSSLSEDGIVKIGTRVFPGDILVGKVTLKGDVQYSPEEKLLRAIFGEKSREVRDTSLRVPPGVEGTIIDIKIFSRSGIRKDKFYKDMVAFETQKIEKEFTEHVILLQKMVHDKIASLLHGNKSVVKSNFGIANGLFDNNSILELSFEDIKVLKPLDDTKNLEFTNIFSTFENQVKILINLKEKRIARLKKGDQLPSGVIKMVKVYIASKRKVSVGDKIAGRHGNKGVVSNIVKREDMPYMSDGTPVDIILNPLGVPGRMNVGQILETILGSVSREAANRLAKVLEEKSYKLVINFLANFFGKDFIEKYESTNGQEGVMELARRTAKDGVYFATPVFDGASLENDIEPLLKDLGLPLNSAYKLRDGQTGEYFDQPITVGTIYIMKLNHMVDDKLHARSVGPYSLVTQQPLGGKAQFGGQRFGEMEVWALEAYGAAYTLQELLTYKSDDVVGRNKVYSAIVRGDLDDIPEPGLPESFNVLIKELQSLALQVDLFKTSREEVSE